jgi:hypothetical protein
MSDGGGCRGAAPHENTLLAARLASRFLTPPIGLLRHQQNGRSPHARPLSRLQALMHCRGSQEWRELSGVANQATI